MWNILYVTRFLRLALYVRYCEVKLAEPTRDAKSGELLVYKLGCLPFQRNVSHFSSSRTPEGKAPHYSLPGFLEGKKGPHHSAGHTAADQGNLVRQENSKKSHCAGSGTCTLRCCENNMDEDEIIKGESPHVPPWRMSAVILENFLFFFLENSDLLLSYVVFATLPDSRRLS